MLAVGVIQGKEGAHSFDLPKPEIRSPDDVLVRIKHVGLDGTDFGMVHNTTHDVAEGPVPGDHQVQGLAP